MQTSKKVLSQLPRDTFGNVTMACLAERITQAVKKNMTKNVETKPAKKKEMERLER